ncbi:MAG: uroporphyrinogen decarboxylase family protein [Candidatus Humimicrobiaceae bacterium]
MKEKIIDIGCVLCYLPRSPLMELITNYVGINNTINFMIDNKKLFEEVIKVLNYKSDEAAEITLNSPAEFLMIPENLSSEMVGKNLFEEYLRPFEEKWTKLIKKKNKYSFIHMDGSLKGLLKEVSSIGFSVIEAMTPAPVGDLDVDQFKSYLNDNTILWGGLPGIFFTPMISEKEFKDFLKKVINIMITEPRYVLGIADQIPPDGLIDRIKIVSNLVEEYGFYD